jgi:transposase InsO family protein
VQRFTPLLIDAARPCRHIPGDRWCVDETYVKVAGRWVYLYRAIDQFGQVIDVLVSAKRDRVATVPAAADAWPQTAPLGPCDQRGTRLRPEHPPRPLQTQRRTRPTAPASGGFAELALAI